MIQTARNSGSWVWSPRPICGEAVQQPVGDVAPLLVEADDALVAAGEIGILEGVADDLGEGDGGDGEIVGAQPQRGQADQDAGDDGDQDGHGHGPPERPAGIDHQHPHGIGADAHEARLAEIEQAGEADIDLQAEHEDAVDAGDHPHAQPEIDAHERAFLRPKIPRGISSRVRIRMAKPMAGFQRGLKNRVDHSWARPMTMPPASAP